jgi:hypothetical protein
MRYAPKQSENCLSNGYDKEVLVKTAQEWILNNRALSEVNKDRVKLVMGL